MTQQNSPSTSTTLTNTYLLEGLKNPDNRTVWRQYVDRYRPLLVSYAGRVGLGAEDAEDVAQQTLIAFCESYQAGKYDREKGRLRGWLFGIARNQVKNWQRKRREREVQVAGKTGQSDFFAQLPEEDRLQELWEQEWRDAVLQECLGQVRQEVGEKSFEAFELFASKGWPAQRVGEHLDLTTNAVFLAKHRILKRIRELMPQIEEIW